MVNLMFKVNKKRNLTIKIIITTFTIIIVGVIIAYIVIANLGNAKAKHKNNNDYNNNLKKEINKYLDHLVPKNDVQSAVYYNNTLKIYQINKDLFDKLYMNSFYKGVNEDYKYNFLSLSFTLSYEQTPSLIANVFITYYIMNKFSENINSSTNIVYSWSQNYIVI